VRGIRYVALGVEPDAAFFEFGDKVTAAALATPPEVVGEAKALLSNWQQEVAAACCTTSAALASPQRCTPLTLAVGKCGMATKAARVGPQQMSMAKPAASDASLPGSLPQAAGVTATVSSPGCASVAPTLDTAAKQQIGQQLETTAVGRLQAAPAVAATGCGAACNAAVMCT
jgi:hypothetical protein